MSRVIKPWPTECPICGSPLAIGPLQLPGDAACPKCAHVLWFSLRTSEGVTIVDVDLSGRVDGLDLARFGRAFGTRMGEESYDPGSDLNRDGAVDGNDLAMLASWFGREAG